MLLRAQSIAHSLALEALGTRRRLLAGIELKAYRADKVCSGLFQAFQQCVPLIGIVRVIASCATSFPTTATTRSFTLCTVHFLGWLLLNLSYTYRFQPYLNGFYYCYLSYPGALRFKSL